MIFADPKPHKRLKDKKFLIWKSDKSCYVCNIIDTEPAHHLRKYGWGGASRKPHDYQTIKLCRVHHDMAENKPDRLWARVDMKDVLKDMVNDILWYSRREIVLTDIEEVDTEEFWRRRVEEVCDFIAKQGGVL